MFCLAQDYGEGSYYQDQDEGEMEDDEDEDGEEDDYADYHAALRQGFNYSGSFEHNGEHRFFFSTVLS